MKVKPDTINKPVVKEGLEDEYVMQDGSIWTAERSAAARARSYELGSPQDPNYKKPVDHGPDATAVDKLFKPWVLVYVYEDDTKGWGHGKDIAYVQVTKDMFMVDPRGPGYDHMVQPTEAGWKHLGFGSDLVERNYKGWSFVDEPEPPQKPAIVRELGGGWLRWTFDGTDWKLG